MNTYNIIVLVSALVILGLSIWAFMTRCNTDKFGNDLPDCVDASELKGNKCTIENQQKDDPTVMCGSYSLAGDNGPICHKKPCCNVECSNTGRGQVGIHCNSGDCHGDMTNPVGCILSDCKDCDFNNPYSLDPDCEICCNYLKKQ